MFALRLAEVACAARDPLIYPVHVTGVQNAIRQGFDMHWAQMPLRCTAQVAPDMPLKEGKVSAKQTHVLYT